MIVGQFNLDKIDCESHIFFFYELHLLRAFLRCVLFSLAVSHISSSRALCSILSSYPLYVYSHLVVLSTIYLFSSYSKYSWLLHLTIYILAHASSPSSSHSSHPCTCFISFLLSLILSSYPLYVYSHLVVLFTICLFSSYSKYSWLLHLTIHILAHASSPSSSHPGLCGIKELVVKGSDFIH